MQTAMNKLTSNIFEKLDFFMTISNRVTETREFSDPSSSSSAKGDTTCISAQVSFFRVAIFGFKLQNNA